MLFSGQPCVQRTVPWTVSSRLSCSGHDLGASAAQLSGHGALTQDTRKLESWSSCPWHMTFASTCLCAARCASRTGWIQEA